MSYWHHWKYKNISLVLLGIVYPSYSGLQLTELAKQTRLAEAPAKRVRGVYTDNNLRHNRYIAKLYPGYLESRGSTTGDD